MISGTNYTHERRGRHPLTRHAYFVAGTLFLVNNSSFSYTQQLTLIFDTRQRRQDPIFRISWARFLLSSPNGPFLFADRFEVGSCSDSFASMNSLWTTKVCAHEVLVFRKEGAHELFAFHGPETWFAFARIF
jgi:hypothetical protein